MNRNIHLADSPLRTLALLGIAIAAGATTLSAQASLLVKTSLPVPSCGTIQEFADVDGSGIPDYLISSPSSPASFRVVTDPTGPAPGVCQVVPVPPVMSQSGITLLVANLNGDSFADVVVGAGSQVLDGYGNGVGGFTFAGIGPYPVLSPDPKALNAVADFDGNGLDDLLLYRWSSPALVEVWLKSASGWTKTWFHTPLGGSSGLSFRAGDFDGDGLQDVFWPEGGSPFSAGTLMVARGLGDGTFSLLPPIPVGVGAQSIHAVSDLDGDGRSDVILSGGPTWSAPLAVPIIFGAPAGTTPSVTSIPTPLEGFARIAAFDVDRDGVRDLVIDGLLSDTPTLHPIVMFRGLGMRQYSTPILQSLETAGSSIALVRLFAADVDGDLDVDLVRSEVLYQAAPTLSLFTNQSTYAPGCPGTGGIAPVLSTGIAALGNASFAIGMACPLWNAPAVLAISFGALPVSGCGVAIDPGPAQLILPTGTLGYTTTDAGGMASIALPIPAIAALQGTVVYAQWGVLDPRGTADALGYPLSISDARTILVW